MSGRHPWGGLVACLGWLAGRGRFQIRPTVAAVCWLLVPAAATATAAELPVLTGPAMGTTYRVVLAGEIPGQVRGEVHRELEAVLARIDRAASTWRDDSDVSRFNRAAAGEWLEVGEDLARIVAIAREVHAQTDGGFDITVAPLVQLWRGGRPDDEQLAAARRLVGMQLIELRPATAGRPAALRKLRAGVELDLGGIGPGYGVDCLGERLAALGSQCHLVELGGEARAWGTRPDGTAWQVATPAAAGGVRDLPPGRAIAFSTGQPSRAPIDPRSGRPNGAAVGVVFAEASSCAEADARAVAIAIGWRPPE